MPLEASNYIKALQPLLSLPRETLPQLTVAEARKGLEWAGEALSLELIEKKWVVPFFLLVPPGGVTPRVLLFAAWHAESLPVLPAAIEGAERLALVASLAGLGSNPDEAIPAALVVAPAATQGSLMLAELLTEYRPRLQAKAAFWLRIGPRAPRRRRIYLGARGRVVLGIWDAGANPYRIRDRMIEELRAEAYGPRPLDFELLRKLGQNRDALDFLEEASDDPGPFPGAGEERLKSALFDPRGQVVVPQVRHPDRPQAWLVFETVESMEPADLLQRARRLAGGTRVEIAEGFLWDRIGIHHPSIQAQIKLAKSVSEGPEIWPAAPWPTPAGIFTRALGTPLAEWIIPIPASVAIRFPKPENFEPIAREASELLRKTMEEIAAPEA
ncbi:MAG: hypothetical protein E6K76_07070 [Candidatus Eisenbacteria bacterium]|uniref:M20/M25/M40 family metallo-hydrolase n=1 Tax=Eiseniibacteriota bacterium TaxID=2212470 RepID=A0A538T4U1_UNCEI|nr:MAG: hypothetical protein E6K76_07070 [Candidatus Eisenbacteria bacterium]